MKSLIVLRSVMSTLNPYPASVLSSPKRDQNTKEDVIIVIRLNSVDFPRIAKRILPTYLFELEWISIEVSQSQRISISSICELEEREPIEVEATWSQRRTSAGSWSLGSMRRV